MWTHSGCTSSPYASQRMPRSRSRRTRLRTAWWSCRRRSLLIPQYRQPVPHTLFHTPNPASSARALRTQYGAVLNVLDVGNLWRVIVRVTGVSHVDVVDHPELRGERQRVHGLSTYDTRHTVQVVRRSKLDANCPHRRGATSRRRGQSQR